MISSPKDWTFSRFVAVGLYEVICFNEVLRFLELLLSNEKGVLALK